MGIPTYFSHIVKKHRKIIKNISEIKGIDNLYLDANSIIYDAVHGLDEDTIEKYETNIIIAVCKKIDYYIASVQPKKKVFIAFDGVAPFAKIKQQQKRRYLTWFNQQLMNDLKKNAESPKWNTASITPGTPFMQSLSAKLLLYFEKNNTTLDIIVSTSNEAGEGEHKIYEYIRKNADYHKNTTTLIYGLDADLIMLTMTHLHISDKIYLYRETPHFIQTIDKTLDPNQSYLIDIPLFAERIVKELSVNDTVVNKLHQNKLHQNKLHQNKLHQNKLHDYIFMCFLLGNDFLPHFPALNIRTNGIEKLITAYLQLFSNDKIGLINADKNIVWKNVRKLIDYLAEHEQDYIQAEYKSRTKQEKNTQTKQKEDLENELLTLPLKDRAVEHFINPFDPDWELRYYNALFDIENVLPEREKEIALNYLEGLEWTFAYYTTGCLDWRWTFKYSYPPLLKDLKKYVPHFEVNFIKKCEKNPISIAEQLNYVLPEDMKKDFIKSSEIKKSDREKKIKWAFCKYLWEAHIE